MGNEDNILNEITDSYCDYSMITEYIIPVDKTIVGDCVFSRCTDLERLYVPWYVKEIPASNFFERKSDRHFIRHYQFALQICGEKDTAAEWCAKEAGVRFFETDKWIQGNTLKAYFGRRKAVEISEGIETIWGRAFQYAPHIESVKIANSVKYINSESFMGCNLEKVNIPKGVRSLGSRVFKDCKNLQCIVFENGDTGLDNDCFVNCANTLIIKAPSGGYVEKYAQNYKVQFESI